MKLHASLIPLLAILLLPSTAAFADTSWQDANRAVVDRHIVPRYQKLAEATAELETRAETLCATPSPANLEAVREGFHRAMDAWMGVQHIRFGPVELYFRYSRFELWPDKHNTGSKQLRKLLADQDMKLLADDQFPYTSVAVQGFSALERLLFAKGKEADAFGTAGAPSYRCLLAKAITRNLATMSAALVKEWTTGESLRHLMLLDAGDRQGAGAKSDAAEASREITSRFLNNLHTALQSIVDQKLIGPLGKSAADAAPRRAESWRSRRSLRNIILNLEAVESFYETGFTPLLADKPDGAELDKQLRQAFETTLAVARAIDKPLYDVVGDAAQRAALERVLNESKVVKSLVAALLPQALDIPLGFNALDGD